MDFLKILLSTLIIAVITALVFFALYFIFPGVSEAWFGVSVNYAPEKMPSASLNGKLAAERAAADGDTAPPVRKEPVTESPAEKAETVPGIGKETVPEVKAEEEPAVRASGKTAGKAAPAPEEEALPSLTEGGEVLKAFMESTKMKVVLSLIPQDYAGMLKSPDAWNADDIAMINKIGDYIVEHGIDIDKETRISNIPKLLNQYQNGELPDYLQDFLDFVQKEVML